MVGQHRKGGRQSDVQLHADDHDPPVTLLDAELTRAHLQSSAPRLTPPVAFSFPTPQSDGSLPRPVSPPAVAAVSSIAEVHPPPATPEAVVYKPLRIPTSMAEGRPLSESTSTSSFADSQYDMIDDVVSDISNDDRETASLASTDLDDDGQLTPEDMGSMIDVEGVGDGEDDEERGNPSVDDTERDGSFEELLIDRFNLDEERSSAAKKSNKLFDSYLSEDMDTPRQSMMPFPRDTARPSASSPSSRPNPTRVMFVSDRSVDDNMIRRIYGRLAVCLSTPLVKGADYRVSRLPPTPRGIHLSSNTLVTTEDVELSVQHCIGAERRSGDRKSFGFHILDTDTEHASLFTIGENAKIGLELPEIAIFFVAEPHMYLNWFDTVKEALRDTTCLILTIREPDGRPFTSLYAYSLKNPIFVSDMVVTRDEYFDERDPFFRKEVSEAMCPKMPLTAGGDTPATPHTRAYRKEVKSHIMKDVRMRVFPFVLIAIFMLFSPLFSRTITCESGADLAVRREALSSALVKMANSTNALTTFNVEHLLPGPSKQADSSLEHAVRFQGAAPTKVVISLPKMWGSCSYPTMENASVSRSDGRPLGYKMTTLIEGVYAFELEPEEAYGTVTVRTTTMGPAFNSTVSHNFGMKMLRRGTYDKVRTDLSKSTNKSLIKTRASARSLADKIGADASLLASNVTTQLSILSNTALSVFHRAAQASNETVSGLIKDFVLIPTDLARFTKDLQRSFASSKAVAVGNDTKSSLKSSIAGRLAQSRARALSLKRRLIGRGEEANSTSASASKELALRLQNVFSPTAQSKKAGSLPDIARCARAPDYEACRREQKAKAKALSTAAVSTEAETKKKRKEKRKEKSDKSSVSDSIPYKTKTNNNAVDQTSPKDKAKLGTSASPPPSKERTSDNEEQRTRTLEGVDAKKSSPAKAKAKEAKGNVSGKKGKVSGTVTAKKIKTKTKMKTKAKSKTKGPKA